MGIPRTPATRKTYLRKRTKQPTERLRAKCVTLAKRIVRHMANYTCAYCGQKEPNVQTHGSHIYSEGTYRAMSADVDNILCLCFTHHTGGWNAKEPSWHKNPVEMVNWFNERYPELAKHLKERSRESIQADFYYWTKKWEQLEKIAKEIGLPT